jgi:non-ribosomal peptide synthetase component F
LALICGDEELTYRQLNSRSNQLAHFLRSLDVGAEMLVGICMPRSIDMVIGILGILKAGGAYVPLDPSYPQERLRFILEDTKARFMIAQSDFVSSLPELTTQIISFDTEQCTIAEQPQENLEKINSSENSNAIYTSDLREDRRV